MKGWPHYLFDKHQVIATSPLKTVACLDVFVKVGSHGVLHRKPCIARVGSLLSLARRDVEGWIDLEEKLRNGLEQLKLVDGQKPASYEIFETGSFASTLQENVKVDTNFFEIMLGVLGFELAQVNLLTISESLSCNARNVTRDSLKPDFLQGIVNEPAKWRPNTTRTELEWPQSSGEKVLWVVTEVLYANKIIIGKKKSMGLGAQLVTPDCIGEAGVQLSKTNDGSLVISAGRGKRVVFGFRATRLTYSWTGKLQTAKVYAKRRAETRADDDQSRTESELKQDCIEHMEDFFVKSSTTDGENEWECLDQVDGIADAEAATSSHGVDVGA